MYLYHWLKSTIKNYNKIIAVYKFNFIGAETGFLSIYVLILFYLCLYWRLSKVFFLQYFNFPPFITEKVYYDILLYKLKKIYVR